MVTGPRFPPTEPRRDAAIRLAGSVHIPHGDEVPAPRVAEHFRSLGRLAAARGEEEGVDGYPVVSNDRPAGGADRLPGQRLLSFHATVYLIGHRRPEIEAVLLPPAHVANGKGTGHDSLGLDGLDFFGLTCADLKWHHPGEV